ncbi:nucleotidyl transferase AbiEii/AbiGii toxin family protein [Porphyromonas gingivalis]|uniref:nucleotidyl transferase AbiEii/AbiGii toxin family protein n=1 Tax=Porphyromonas gingivalis TaxID=837 RepID=UPI000C1A09C0|nr:nucleotidyl transferase AbiEii/AbiGii toxin family protein [Porphyromonas gingivalis]ATS02849.1 nucleotidyltransferase [Porphyromonas gingivalis]
MEHTIKEYLHLDPESFMDLVQASSEDLKIPVQLIEKDYYISEILRALSKSSYSQQIVFKGGTSLSKAYLLIDRFSEDVDFTVISENMSGNQVKMLLSNLMKEVTASLTEDKSFSDISKGSKYRKQAFSYDAQVGLDVSVNPIPSRIVVEISAFANPFPYEKRMIEPFVTTYLKKRNMEDVVTQYYLEPFELNVLSLRQTLCEKTVSLIRFSISEDPLASLSSKIRHFYDLNALLAIKELEEYVCSEEFVNDVETLVKHDQEAFDEPAGWKDLKDLNQSPLVMDFDKLWDSLAPKYEENLSAIAYREIPSSETIKASFLKILKSLRVIDLTKE